MVEDPPLVLDAAVGDDELLPKVDFVGEVVDFDVSGVETNSKLVGVVCVDLKSARILRATFQLVREA